MRFKNCDFKWGSLGFIPEQGFAYYHGLRFEIKDHSFMPLLLVSVGYGPFIRALRTFGFT